MLPDAATTKSTISHVLGILYSSPVKQFYRPFHGLPMLGWLTSEAAWHALPTHDGITNTFVSQAVHLPDCIDGTFRGQYFVLSKSQLLRTGPANVLLTR